MHKGDRKDASTAEGDPNRMINRAQGKDSYLIDVVTNVAIESNRVLTGGAALTMHLPGVIFYFICSAFPPYMELIRELSTPRAASDILTALRKRN